MTETEVISEHRWAIVAKDRNGHGAVELAWADTEEAAENIVQAIADAIRGGQFLLEER